MDMFEELKGLIAAFEDAAVEYALCGGLALAVHAAPRATIDMDFLVSPGSFGPALRAAESRGYRPLSDDMEFLGGIIRVHRRVKLPPGEDDPLILDFLPVTDALAPVFASREQVPWEGGGLWVVSRSGLIYMKRLRSSPQDLVDIATLEETGRENP